MTKKENANIPIWSLFFKICILNNWRESWAVFSSSSITAVGSWGAHWVQPSSPGKTNGAFLAATYHFLLSFFHFPFTLDQKQQVKRREGWPEVIVGPLRGRVETLPPLLDRGVCFQKSPPGLLFRAHWMLQQLRDRGTYHLCSQWSEYNFWFP